MFGRIRTLLEKEGVFLSAPIALADCTIKKAYLLDQAGISPSGTAVIFAIPYYSEAAEHSSRNLSRYAVGRDYHLFVKMLSECLIPILTKEFPKTRFSLFADHSPIDEREAAAKAGLGILGKNGLLITKPYSSYVFLGEIITDAPLPSHLRTIQEISYCENCGACAVACPLCRGEIGECLSALTQKKTALTEKEEQALERYGSVWGCDICQEVCPHTKSAIQSEKISCPIPFFRKKLLPHLTYDGIRMMSDAEFSERAYAWRGRSVVLRNLAIMERKDEEEKTQDNPLG